MIKFNEWYLPDGEKHLSEWMFKVNRVVEGRLTYQYHKYEAALKLCSDRLVAVDVGAHVGLLSYWMARDFGFVNAFEPVEAHRECFKSNVLHTRSNVNLHACALGEKEGFVKIHTEPTSSGDSRVDGSGDIPMHTLDSFDLEDVSFLKIDAEGFEKFILSGAEGTLLRCMPALMIEQKPGHGKHFGIGDTDAIPYLEELGYKVVKIMSGDYLMVPG